MAVSALTTAGVYVNELDASGFVNELSSPFSCDMETGKTTLADGGFQRAIPTLRHGQITIGGIQDFASGGFYEKLNQSDLSAISQAIIVPGGASASVGDPAAFIVGFIEQLVEQDGAAGQVATINVAWAEGSTSSSLTGVMAFGPCLHPLTSRSSSGNGTAFAMAGPSATQIMVAAQAITVGSGGTFTTIITSDDASNFPSATTRISFTAQTGPSFEAKMAAGSAGWATETHHRVQYTVSAGSYSFVVACAVLNAT